MIECRYCHRRVSGPRDEGYRRGRLFIAHPDCARVGVKGAAPKGQKGTRPIEAWREFGRAFQ